MTKKDNFIFQFIHVITWIIFVALCIEAGGLLVNFIFSIFKPEVISKLYNKLDLTKIYQVSKWAYFSAYSFAIIIAIMKAVLFYIAIDLLMKFNLKSPFSTYVENKIRRLSYVAFWIGLLSYMAQEAAQKLSKRGFDLDKLPDYWSDSRSFIMMAAIIYIIAIIFKKGNELQNENDLTI